MPVFDVTLDYWYWNAIELTAKRNSVGAHIFENHIIAQVQFRQFNTFHNLVETRLGVIQLFVQVSFQSAHIRQSGYKRM